MALDGEQGLQMLESSHFKPDLIILDLNIPKVFGLSFLGRYRAEAPVVVFTVSTNPHDRRRSLELGARAYVEKPDDLDEYCRVVSNIVRNRDGADTPSISPGSPIDRPRHHLVPSVPPDATEPCELSRGRAGPSEHVVRYRRERHGAGTLCDRAKSHPDPEHRAEILRKIKQAIETVRYFAVRIDDHCTRKEILDQADELERRVGM